MQIMYDVGPLYFKIEINYRIIEYKLYFIFHTMFIWRKICTFLLHVNVYAYCISLICDKSVKTQNFGIFELLVQKETFADALLTGTVS